MKFSEDFFSEDFLTASKMCKDVEDLIAQWQLLHLSTFDNATHDQLRSIEVMFGEMSRKFHELHVYWKYRC